MSRSGDRSLSLLRIAALELNACRQALHNERVRLSSGEQVPLSYFYPHATKLARLCSEERGLMELLGITSGDLQLFLIKAGQGIVRSARSREGPGFDPGPEKYYVSLARFIEEHDIPKELIGVTQEELDRWKAWAEEGGITTLADKFGEVVE